MVAFNINGAGFKGFRVNGVEAGLVGFYSGGKPYRPDAAAVRAALPYRLRAAFDRANGTWWFIQDGAAAYVDLRGSRGKYLGRVNAYGVA